MVASVGFYSSNIFYDSLLMDVTEPRYYSFVSTLGFSLGYLGGALLLGLHVWMILSPEPFGFAGPDSAIRFAFVSVGIWWAIFATPLMLFVPEQRSKIARTQHVIQCCLPGTTGNDLANSPVSQRRDLPRRVLALYSWRFHDHRHGRQLRPTAGLQSAGPRDGVADHELRRLSGDLLYGVVSATVWARSTVSTLRCSSTWSCASGRYT